MMSSMDTNNPLKVSEVREVSPIKISFEDLDLSETPSTLKGLPVPSLPSQFGSSHPMPGMPQASAPGMMPPQGSWDPSSFGMLNDPAMFFFNQQQQQQQQHHQHHGGPPPPVPYMPGMYPNPWVPWGGAMPWSMPMYPGMGGMMPPPAGVQAPGDMRGQRKQNLQNANSKGQGSQRERRRRGRAKQSKDQAVSPAPASEDGDDNHSALLTEVRKHGGKSKLTLKDVMPNVLEFCYDQTGSRFIQTKLDDANDGERLAVCNAILPETAKLASDSSGNFVVQKLFEIVNVECKKQLASKLQGEVMRLSQEAHGCRVIQRAIQHVPRESQLQLAGELHGHVVSCIEDMNGNHVIQKCIEQMPPDSVDFIIKAVEEQTERMAAHTYGCRVIQRLLEHCASHQLERMLEQILSATARLASDPFGNYVVQHMLEHGRREDKRRIIAVVQTNILEFAKHKCSSNVVERCFEIATVGEHAQVLEAERQALVSAVLGNPSDPHPPLYQMMEDRFGNYIVQRMIEHSRGFEKDLLRQRLMAVKEQLRGSSSGRHILAALDKEFPRGQVPVV